MGRKAYAVILSGITMLCSGCALLFAAQAHAQANAISPSTMIRTGQIDERFQSYNIETVEVTGGRFWKPYDQGSSVQSSMPSADKAQTAPGGMDPSLYQYRPPIDLSNTRLRKLAAALGPAYIRVSGTWMNSTFFQNSDGPAPATPPKGFNSVLTRQEWKGVVDFAHAANAKIVTSFATSAGTRDAEGVWTPDQARQFLAYTKSVKGSIAAAEFMNEPTFAEMGGAPKGYDAQAYAKDFAVFQKFAKAEAPEMLIIGPGGVGEGSSLVPPSMHLVASADILAATGPVFDVVSYHSYGAVSSRCGRMGAAATTSSDDALTEGWLSRGERIEAFYAGLRDRFESGKPLWNTETAEAACGGDRWASTFLDSFRYLNQLGSLAKDGVQVHMYNTLDASDYGLLDEKTYEPRPNYWAALLWRKLMGNTVLDVGVLPATDLHLYAQCLRGKQGGVAVLAINADKSQAKILEIPSDAERYTLTAQQLLDAQVELNGSELKLGNGDSLPVLKSITAHSGDVTFAPASITFLAFPNAGNASCR